ncbi:hypothetical protein QQF64_034962 [Cirrhinus molitorella]|uniref:Uncharacterized protein n=1 Tax=Cirrhinus molitorella TaxID=172907 RepID=A0ABR3NEE1_9TELE
MKGLSNNEQAANYCGLMLKLAWTSRGFPTFSKFCKSFWRNPLQLHLNPHNYDRGPNDLRRHKFCRPNEHFRVGNHPIPSSAADESKRSRNCMRL